MYNDVNRHAIQREDYLLTHEMLSFYNVPVMLATSCSVSLILTAIVILFIRKRNKQIFLLVLAILQVSFVVALVLFYFLGYTVQAQIATPYIQKALDEQCAAYEGTAEAEGFQIDSGFRWSSNDKAATCYYNNGYWVCSCSSE